MENTLATLEPLCHNRVNRLCNGDFIDLTSEGEPQKTVEDDVVLVDGSNGEDEIPLPIGSSRINNSSVTQQVSSFVVRKDDYRNISTKHFMVPSKTERISVSSGGVGKKLVSASDPPGSKKDVVTITLLPNTSERTPSVLHTALQKASNKIKSATNQSLLANKNSPRAKSGTPKKPRVIRKSSNIPSGSAPKIRIKNCVLLPSSSEVGDQTAKQKPAPPEKVAKEPNKPVYYILTPKSPVIPSKGPVVSSKGPVLTSKGPTELPHKLQTNVFSPTTSMKSGGPVNVIKQSQLTVLDKNTLMRLQKNMQNNILLFTPTKSVPLNTSTVQNPNLMLPSLAKSPTKSYTRSKSEITTKIQHVQVIEDEVSTLSQEESQRIDVPPNFLIDNEKDDVVGLFVYPFAENDPSSLTVPQPNDGCDEFEDTQLMTTVEEDEEMVIESHEEVPQSNEIKYEPDDPDDLQIIETVEEDEDEEVILESKEGILIESVKNDPLDDVVIEPSSLVTPVDIEKILNEANLLKAKAVEDRCKCNYMKNQVYMYRGFTRREMRKPSCYKYLQTLIKLNKAKIQVLKKSIASYEENFIHCGGTLNNFLPEVSKCEDYDSDEYTIEYSSIDTKIHSLQIPSVISKVNEQVKALETKRTVNKKTAEEIKSTLAEPEEALKLIQKGLELIRIWKDKANKSLPVTSTRKSVPVEAKRRAKSIEPKPVSVSSPPKTAVRARGKKKVETSAPQEAIEVGKRKRRPKKQLDEEPVITEIGKRKRKPKKQLDDEPAIKKQTTDNRHKVETVKAVTTATIVETKPTRRSRGCKKQTVEYNDPDPNDNELFVIKKVDILNDKRKRRK